MTPAVLRWISLSLLVVLFFGVERLEAVSLYEVIDLGACTCKDKAIACSRNSRRQVIGIAMDVNDEGTIVGSAEMECGCWRAVVWRPGKKVEALGSLGGCYSQANSINLSGVIVGWGRLPTGCSHAFVWDERGGMRDLNRLIAPDSGWRLSEALFINPDGEITGSGNYKGRSRTFLLKPTGGEVEQKPPQKERQKSPSTTIDLTPILKKLQVDAAEEIDERIGYRGLRASPRSHNYRSERVGFPRGRL